MSDVETDRVRLIPRVSPRKPKNADEISFQTTKRIKHVNRQNLKIAAYEYNQLKDHHHSRNVSVTMEPLPAQISIQTEEPGIKGDAREEESRPKIHSSQLPWMTF